MPAIGLNVVVMATIASDTPMVAALRSVTPFVIICLVAVVPLAAFPGIALWLPSLMGGLHALLRPTPSCGLAPRAG